MINKKILYVDFLPGFVASVEAVLMDEFYEDCHIIIEPKQYDKEVLEKHRPCCAVFNLAPNKYAGKTVYSLVKQINKINSDSELAPTIQIYVISEELAEQDLTRMIGLPPYIIANAVLSSTETPLLIAGIISFNFA